MIINNYMTTPATHAAYMRSSGDSFKRYTDKRSAEMPIEAAAIEADLKANKIPEKSRAYMRQRVVDLRERAPLVKQMGIAFRDTFHASANRIEK